MGRTFKEAYMHRRSYYDIDNRISVSDEELIQMVEFTVKHTPSAFNSQSTRLVLLLGKRHQEFWQMVKDSIRKIVPPTAFQNTEIKINHSFASGYGTVLFYEDTEVIEGLQKAFQLYAENFPVWAQHTSAMHQLALWTLLEDAGLGASLQHYNPLIDQELVDKWEIPSTWKLVAQMPFGNPIKEPGDKNFAALDKRVLVLR